MLVILWHRAKLPCRGRSAPRSRGEPEHDAVTCCRRTGSSDVWLHSRCFARCVPCGVPGRLSRLEPPNQAPALRTQAVKSPRWQAHRTLEGNPRMTAATDANRAARLSSPSQLTPSRDRALERNRASEAVLD